MTYSYTPTRPTLGTPNVGTPLKSGQHRLTDSQPKNVLDASKIWHTDGTQYEPNRDFLIARHP